VGGGGGGDDDDDDDEDEDDNRTGEEEEDDVSNMNLLDQCSGYDGNDSKRERRHVLIHARVQTKCRQLASSKPISVRARQHASNHTAILMVEH
jgi:hypothetical protein